MRVKNDESLKWADQGNIGYYESDWYKHFWLFRLREGSLEPKEQRELADALEPLWFPRKGRPRKLPIQQFCDDDNVAHLAFEVIEEMDRLKERGVTTALRDRAVKAIAKRKKLPIHTLRKRISEAAAGKNPYVGGASQKRLQVKKTG